MIHKARSHQATGQRSRDEARLASGARAPKPSAIRTRRLQLVPGTRAALELLLYDPSLLVEALGVDLAPDWCDLEFDEEGPYVLREMRPESEEVGWWYWWLIEEPWEGPVVRPRPTFIGYLGFKGPPSKGGNVELMYAVAPSARRRGLISEALGELLHWAYRSSRVRSVLAAVVPENAASLRVLEKHGFTTVEVESDEERVVLRHERGQLVALPSAVTGR